jgi:hypothetical protein
MRKTWPRPERGRRGPSRPAPPIWNKSLSTSRTRQGDSLREIRIKDYTSGLIVTIVGLGLYSYYVRELLAALTIFSVAFFFLSLVGLGALLIWCASVQVAIWTRPASRNVIAFSRRLIAAYARP